MQSTSINSDAIIEEIEIYSIIMVCGIVQWVFWKYINAGSDKKVQKLTLMHLKLSKHTSEVSLPTIHACLLH